MDKRSDGGRPMPLDVKKLTVLSMLTALAYIVSVLLRIPFGAFLTYDMKDVLFTIGGFLYGSISMLPVIAAVCLLEMVTVSGTGIIGAVMAFVSSVSFVSVAAMIYQYRRKLSGAVIGLLAGTLLATLTMLLWNVFLTPLYLGIPLEGVKEILVPIVLPFNLLKGFLNSGVIMLVYKPLTSILRRLGILEETGASAKLKKRTALIAILALAVSVCSFALLIGWTLS